MITGELDNFWSLENNLSGWWTLRLDGAKVLMSDNYDACISRIKEVEKLPDEATIAFGVVEKDIIYPTSYFIGEK